MKDITRQIAVIISVLVTLTVNTLANALPLNGLNTGQISDQFKVYFVPAGYVFAIWGLIYIGLIALTIFQALPSQRENPRLRATGWWIVLGGLANSSWIFLWHYQQFPWTVPVMLVLLVSLIITYLRMGINRVKVTAAERWTTQIPIRVYLGWISVATIANIADVLDFARWDGFGIAAQTWTVILLVVVLVLTGLMIFLRRDVAYALVILWALVGIALKQAGTPTVATTAWIVFGLVLVLLAIRLLRNPKPGIRAQVG